MVYSRRQQGPHLYSQRSLAVCLSGGHTTATEGTCSVSGTSPCVITLCLEPNSDETVSIYQTPEPGQWLRLSHDNKSIMHVHHYREHNNGITSPQLRQQNNDWNFTTIQPYDFVHMTWSTCVFKTHKKGSPKKSKANLTNFNLLSMVISKSV